MKREKELKEQASTLDTLAWNIGSYVVDGLAMFFGRNHTPYPQMPRSAKENNNAPNGNGETMSDGAKFAAFMVAHNKQLRERRNK